MKKILLTALLVLSAASAALAADYYLVGAATNNWASREKFVAQDNGTYTLHFDTFAGEFKICPDATSWTNSWGHYGKINLDEDVALEYGNNPSNIGIDGDPELSDVTFTLTPGEGTNLTLKVTAGSSQEIIPDFYIACDEIGGWVVTNGLKLEANDGVYEGNTTTVVKSFKVVAHAASDSWYGKGSDDAPAYNVAMPLGSGDNIDLPQLDGIKSMKFIVTVDSKNVPQTVKVIADTTSGIVEIEATVGAVEYYNIQGVRVDNPTKGMFIEVRGNKAVKIVK